jgi:hypothetical protein
VKDEAHLNRRDKKHMDYSIALAIAIYTAILEGASDDTPIFVESRYSDTSEWNISDDKLPWMFRSDE